MNKEALLAMAKQAESPLEGAVAHAKLNLPGVYNPYMLEMEKYWAQHDIQSNFDWLCKHKPAPGEDEFSARVRSWECSYNKRTEMIFRYSFAMPTQEAIDRIASFGKILEVGAGTGYWSNLLLRAGADVIAVDKAPIDLGPIPPDSKLPVLKNQWPFTTSWFPVQQGDGPTFVDKYTPEYTLFMCWPNYNDSFAYDCLAASKGEYAIYIGEQSTGCTAGDDFFALLGEEYGLEIHNKDRAEPIPHLWDIVEEIDLPQWPGIHDCLYILKRK